MTERDPRCGCPTEALTPNRGDRREMRRVGVRAALVTMHNPQCWLGGRPKSLPTRRAVRKISRKRRT